MYPRLKLLSAMGVLAACAFSAAAPAANFAVTTPAEFQAALTAAASNGEDDTVQVAAGTYALAATLSYVAAANEGALTITGAGPATTILDGQDLVQVMSLDSTAAGGVTVEVVGLTFRNGAALSDGDTGGGLEIRTGSGGILVDNCAFLGNRSADDGGGLYARITNLNETPITVLDSLFDGNRTLGSGSDGGGAHISASGFAGVTVSGCEFIGNASQDAGGGLQVEGLDPGDIERVVGSVFLADNLFRNNSTEQVSSGEGGGADIAARSIDIRANQFYGNSGSAGGGAYLREFTSLSMVNSVFMGNRAAFGNGGGFAMPALLDGFVRLINNTVFGNTASARGGGGELRVGGTASFVEVYNSILWGNAAGETDELYIDNNPFNDAAGGARVALVANDRTADGIVVTCVAPICGVTLSDNVDLAPQLANETGPAYDPHLLPASPLIDAGDNGAPTLPSSDFEGDARVIGGTVDIGADEFTGAAPPPSADVSITLTDAPDPVASGERLTYTVTLTNAGPDGADAVSVSDALPAGTSFVSATPSQGSCSPAAGTASCSLGALPNGGSATITIVVDVTAEVGVTLSNVVTVNASTADPDLSNNSVIEQTQVVAPPELQADLQVAVAVTPSEPSVDDTLTWTVTVSNAGPDDEPGATLVVVLPTSAELESVTPTQGSCKVSSGGASCVLGPLADGGQATVTIVMTATEAGTLTLEATAQGELADEVTANNTAQGQAVVTDVVELVVKGKGGGGSFGWVELLGLAGLLLVRFGRRARDAVSLASLLFVVSLAGVPVAASADDAGWYAGASLGASSADYGSSDLARDLDKRGWTILDPRTDDSDTFWKAYVGYQVNSFIAVEVGYADLGEVETSYRAILPPSEIPDLLSDTLAVHPYLGSGWTASGLLSGSFAEDAFAVFARAGMFVWEADIEVKVVSGGTGKRKGDESGTDAMFGVGFDWRINPAWVVRVEWERYKLNDWVDVPSAGIVWRFR